MLRHLLGYLLLRERQHQLLRLDAHLGQPVAVDDLSAGKNRLYRAHHRRFSILEHCEGDGGHAGYGQRYGSFDDALVGPKGESGGIDLGEEAGKGLLSGLLRA